MSGAKLGKSAICFIYSDFSQGGKKHQPSFTRFTMHWVGYSDIFDLINT